jgi:hypothetical protein
LVEEETIVLLQRIWRLLRRSRERYQELRNYDRVFRTKAALPGKGIRKRMRQMDIGVYGLGRFGSFWAEHLSKHFAVKGYSRSSRRSTPSGVERVSEEELLNQPVIFLCVAISAMEDVASRIAPRLKPGSLVMDTCSVKVYPASVMDRSFPTGVDILFCRITHGSLPDTGDAEAAFRMGRIFPHFGARGPHHEP